MISLKMSLIEEAMSILHNNIRDSYTIPASGQYPNQWSWDSAFIAIGYSNYNQELAMSEILSIFEGQWKNGMLPHIVYRKPRGYFPGPGFWETHRSEHAPKIKTSGITQPPVHAIAALQTYRHARDKELALRFLRKIYPRILRFHRYLMTKRDPERSGLVTIFHPWESGLDNSIRWDGPMSNLAIKGQRKVKRKDNQKVKAIERPTDEDYKRFIALAKLIRGCDYDEKELYKRSPFRVKEVIFSTILLQANRSLLEIARILGRSDKEIKSWIARTERNYLRYFCEDVNEKPIVFDYDLVEDKRILKRTSAALISLYSGLLTREQAGTILKWMKTGTFYKKQHGPIVSSTSIYEQEFNPVNYWRGPIWININWLIYKGLKHHGFDKDAESMWNAFMQLIRKSGFHEYYNPFTGKGLGARNFSWTASLLLDILFEDRRVRQVMLSDRFNSDNVLSYLKDSGVSRELVKKLRVGRKLAKSWMF
jgi:glycogen debranching enzyme